MFGSPGSKSAPWSIRRRKAQRHTKAPPVATLHAPCKPSGTRQAMPPQQIDCLLYLRASLSGGTIWSQWLGLYSAGMLHLYIKRKGEPHDPQNEKMAGARSGSPRLLLGDGASLRQRSATTILRPHRQ